MDDELLVVYVRFRAKGTTPRGHEGRQAKRAAFAANLRRVRASLKQMLLREIVKAEQAPSA